MRSRRVSPSWIPVRAHVALLLEELGVDTSPCVTPPAEYIDLFLLHDPLAGSDKRLAAYRALWDKQKEGKVKDIGVSNFGVRHLEELLGAGLPTPAVNQIEVCLSRHAFQCLLEGRD